MDLFLKNIRNRTIKTKNGDLKTPFFMPDATRGFVKFLENEDLEKSGVVSLVVNTYHLYLQPGMEVMKKAGGIHGFMNYHKPLLSDSGGYQIFSLIHKNPDMGEINDNEVVFRSPLDGSKHVLTPEKSIQIQFDLGVDMMVCLDDPPPNSYSKEKISRAVKRTVAWAERCLIEYKKQLEKRKIDKERRPLIFCVIQGGEHIDLRKKCTEGLKEVGEKHKINWDGYGFGARHIDVKGNFMENVLKKTADFIPDESLKFALGVGSPKDVVRCAEMGWDMFDCVIPTREGRHGRLFVWENDYDIFEKNSLKNGKDKINFKNFFVKGDFYSTININNKNFKKDFRAVDENCDCGLCKNHSRAYLNHLFRSKDPLGMRLAAIHNLRFYSDLMEILRKAVK
ncbi:MAG: tRNA guanosine(34) transglycosylase Tgt [Candidatus Moranbacteria bacterium]|jgi:queuine tRNA-ribosyltransferase|nr:tRNA guanosine(34) transglycosylase Tgt [Candidatus Moranbacteria bacterium]MDD5652116.1 tRNA guanosine(34) transglycosylase Tgt [Candidatus Moranbacteria bacterium]MDX9855193.1 tRNA guanosine(34) transglycosylase Tgt [Candidatus Moranbacteria bacterium]